MKIFEFFLGLIYPWRCPLCHDILIGHKGNICPKCLKALPVVVEPRCKRCSKALTGEGEYCFDCRSKKHFFDEGYSVLSYNEKMRQSIVYFKFYGRREYGNFYAEILTRFSMPAVKRWQPEVLLPVPIHRRRRNARGYNQTEVIGHVLSKGFSIPIRTDLIKRVKNTKAQKESSINERKQNIKDAFAVNEEIRQYERVLLIDDVYTTGSTVNEIAKVLKAKGVKQVYFVTVCIGNGF